MQNMGTLASHSILSYYLSFDSNLHLILQGFMAMEVRMSGWIRSSRCWVTSSCHGDGTTWKPSASVSRVLNNLPLIGSLNNCVVHKKEEMNRKPDNEVKKLYFKVFKLYDLSNYISTISYRSVLYPVSTQRVDHFIRLLGREGKIKIYNVRNKSKHLIEYKK